MLGVVSILKGNCGILSLCFSIPLMRLIGRGPLPQAPVIRVIYSITANPGSTDQVLSAEGDYLDICDRSQHNMPKTSEVYRIYSYPFLIFTAVAAINTLLIFTLSLQISVSSGHCGDPRRCLSSHYYFFPGGDLPLLEIHLPDFH